MHVIESQCESGLNRLLRRADWRFLLPNPNPQHSLCFADGLLAKAAATISKNTLPISSLSTNNTILSEVCDLTVATNPTTDTLKTAWSALQWGGTCYTEWHSPFLGGVQGIKQRLAAAGFDDITCYWFWPLPQSNTVKFWLPVEDPSVLRYFLNTRPPTHSLSTKALRLLWPLALRSSFIAPICAIARKSPPNLPATFQPILLEHLRAHWSTWGLGPSPKKLSQLLLTGGRRSENKAVGLIFDVSDFNKSEQPQIVIRWSRTTAGARGLAHEKAALKTLQDLHPEGLPGTPRLLFYEENAQYTTLVQTALAGRPIFDFLQSSTFRLLALQATDWLINLAGHPPLQPRAQWWTRLVEPLLTTFESQFGTVAKPEQLQLQRQLIDTLHCLPLVCEHRDFELWNVQRAPNGNLLVLDWEAAEPEGLPMLDLVLFLAYLSLCTERAMNTPQQARAGYRAILSSTNATGRVIAECLHRYAQHVGVPATAIHALRVLTWLIHTRWEYEDFSYDVSGKPATETLKSSLFFNLWEEELQAYLNNKGLV